MDTSVVKKEGPSVVRERDVSSMPLVTVTDVLRVLIAFCNCRTRLSFAKLCPETNQRVMEAIRMDSRLSLAKFSIVTLDTTPPWIECDSAEVRGVVAAASSEQFVLCVSHCCALWFVKRGFDHWFVAVHCDDRKVTAVGWKQSADVCSQRPIASPMTALPSVEVSQKWQATVRGTICSMAKTKSGETIAVGTNIGEMALLNAHTGAIVTDSMKGGTYVSFVDKQRGVGVKGSGGKWFLCEFTADTLLSKELPLETEYCESAKASAKRLYVGDYNNEQLLEYSTADWHLTARIPLSGKPQGKCDIASNGLLAQGIYRSEQKEDEFCQIFLIELIETSTRCVSQTIRTKHSGQIFQVAFSPDSSRIASVAWGESMQLQVFDTVTGEMVGERHFGNTAMYYVSSVCWLSNQWLLTVSTDKSIAVWHCASQQYVARIEDAHVNGITYIQRLSDNSFATGDFGSTVKKWSFDVKDVDK